MLLTTKLHSAFDQWNDIFNDFSLFDRSSFVSEKDDGSSVFSLDLPGFSKEEIEVSIEGDHGVRVRAVSKSNKRKTTDYVFSVPRNADLDNIKANLENGVLTLSLQSLPRPKSKMIAIE